MRDEREITSRIDDLLQRRLKEFKESRLSQSPRNCSYNTRFRVTGQGQVGFCQNPVLLKKLDMKAFVCNDCDTSRQCKLFRCRNTEESVREEFDEILRSPQRCGEKFPKLAVLIWVVQGYASPTRGRRFVKAISGLWGAILKLTLFRWW